MDRSSVTPRRLPVILLLVAALGSGALVAPAAGAAPRAYVLCVDDSDNTGPLVRPTSCTFESYSGGTNTWITKIGRWRGWGSPQATARATFPYGNAGIKTRATIRLSSRKRCTGYRGHLYRRLEIVYRGRIVRAGKVGDCA